MAVVATSGSGHVDSLHSTADGTLWQFYNGTSDAGVGGLIAAYSKDFGVTWTRNTAAADVVQGAGNFPSTFIDQDDYLHLFFRQNGDSTGGPGGGARTNGRLYYMRATPNAGRTAWTWSAHLLVSTYGSLTTRVKAWRAPGASPVEWDVYTWHMYNNNDGVTEIVAPVYNRMRISNAGTITKLTNSGTTVDNRTYNTAAQGMIAFSTDRNSISGRLDIDFTHNGDGKTVLSGNPSLLLFWAAGVTNRGDIGIHRAQATWSPGSNSYSWALFSSATTLLRAQTGSPGSGSIVTWCKVVYDGAKFIYGGQFQNNDGTAAVYIFESPANTSTFTETIALSGVHADPANQCNNGTIGRDIASNKFWFIGGDGGAAGSRNFYRRLWDHGTKTFGAKTAFVTNGSDGTNNIAVRPGFAHAALDWVWDHSGSTNHQRLSFNNPPTGQLVTAPNGGETWNSQHTITWATGSDPEGDTLVVDIDLSTDGGANYTRIVTGTANDGSHLYDFTPHPSSSTCLIRVRGRDPHGAVSAWDTSNANFTIQHNVAPTAPVLLSPSNNSSTDLASGVLFDWNFTDPDAGDSQTAYYMRRKIGAGAYEYWNASTALWGGTETRNARTASDYTFTSGKWTNGNTYNWSIATEDALGVKGPYATDFSVTGSVGATVTITGPPATVTSTTRPTVSWTFSDPEGDPQQTYQVIVYTLAQATIGGFTIGTSPSTWDSGEVTSTSARNVQVGTVLSNTVTYRAYVRIKTANQYSGWVNSTFTISISPPAVPLLTASADPANGRINLTVQGRDNMLTSDRSKMLGAEWISANVTESVGATPPTNGGDDVLTLTTTATAAAIHAYPNHNTGTQQTDIVTPTANTATCVLWVRAPAGLGYEVRVRGVYADDNTFVGDNLATSGAQTGDGGWQRHEVAYSVTNPRGMKLHPFFSVSAAQNTGAVGTVYSLAGAGLHPTSSAPSAWSRGGLVGTTTATIEYTDQALSESLVVWKAVPGTKDLALPSTTQRLETADELVKANKERHYRAVVSGTV